MNTGMEKAKGRIKEITGKLTGHERLEAEGRTDQMKAKIRKTMTNVRHRAEGIRDSLKHDR
ncbi:CsbD family protein [Streptomyces sp. NRRL B-24572]|uniref:CsbD family protein n=1 Tax=Streptomyces sp. NRRL B-24572 TaxID=1962156 RepID=UPI00211ADDAF|nr:CsbD family protein [Streptomyces sp. NRRL B-24572]